MYKRLISLLLCLMLPVFPVSASAMAESGDGLKGALGAALLGQTELPQSGAGSRPYLALYIDYQSSPNSARSPSRPATTGICTR